MWTNVRAIVFICLSILSPKNLKPKTSNPDENHLSI